MEVAPPLNFTGKEREVSSLHSTPVQRAEEESSMSREEELLLDIETGVESAKEQVDYILKAVEFYAQNGKKLPTEVIQAAENLEKIGKRISTGLYQVGNQLGGVNEKIVWARSMIGFAQSTKNLDVTNPQSIEAWIKSARNHGEASQFLKKQAASSLKKKAFDPMSSAGTANYAAKASITLNVFSAYLEVGIAALDAGNKQVNHYVQTKTEELDAILASKNRPYRGGISTQQAPQAPALWKSHADKLADQKQREAYQKWVNERRIENTITEKAYDLFNQKLFPKIYLRNRKRIAQKIIDDKTEYTIRNTNGYMRGPLLRQMKWYECFITEATRGNMHFPPLQQIDSQRAKSEIYNFLKRGVNCPFFDKIHHREMAKFKSALPTAVALAQKGTPIPEALESIKKRFGK